MALRNFGTGPMAIGGTDAPGSINLELGRAQNATSSLNETDFRTLSGKFTGEISLFDFYGKSAIPPTSVGFMVTMSTNRSALGVAVDSQKNIIISSNHSTNGRLCPVILKISPTGTIIWQRLLFPLSISNSSRGIGITVDSTDAIYVCGFRTISAGRFTMMVIKYNSGGNLQSIRQMSSISTIDGLEQGVRIVLGDSNSVYISGTSTKEVSQVNRKMILAKIDSALNTTWYRYSGKIGPQYHQAFDVTNDSQDRPAVFGTVLDNVTNKHKMSLIAYNANGNSRFQQVLGNDSTDTFGYACCASGTDIYIGGTTQSGTQGIIAKYNASGILQWQGAITLGANSSVQIWGLCSDSAGIIYATGTANGNMFWISVNSSGTILTQRSMSGTDLTNGESIIADDTFLYIVGGDTTSKILKLPKDGSLTGNYAGISYQPITFTIVSASLTSNSLSFSYNVNDSFVSNAVTTTYDSETGLFTRTFTGIS